MIHDTWLVNYGLRFQQVVDCLIRISDVISAIVLTRIFSVMACMIFH